MNSIFLRKKGLLSLGIVKGDKKNSVQINFELSFCSPMKSGKWDQT